MRVPQKSDSQHRGLKKKEERKSRKKKVLCMYDHLVQVGKEKWVQVLCMYDHLCVVRKGEVGAGVVYV